MYLDYLAAAAIADEIRTEMLGARVQSIVQVDRLGVALEIYSGRRWYLVLSAGGQREELVLSQRRVRRGADPATPLTLALRARLIGARLERVLQPPLERILIFEFRAAEESRLVAELMGRMANVILLGADGAIVAAARPVTARMTSTRTILPRHPYVPPPEPSKALPEGVGAAELGDWLGDTPHAAAWRVLISRVRGVSPLAAREIVARAAGDAEKTAGAAAADAAAIAAELRALYALPASHRWEPCIVRDADAVTAYAPYRITHLSGVEPVAAMHQAIEAFERARAGADPYRTARQEVTRLLQEARRRADRRLAALARQQPDETKIEGLRLFGDLILAYQSLIHPRQTALEAPLDPDAPPLNISLDPELTPVENAQRYYKRYQRAKRAAVDLPRRIEVARGALATLDQAATDLALAENRAAIDAVHDALVEGGLLGRPARRRSPGISGHLTCTSSDGFNLLVGRNSRQNEVVTFQRAKRGDRWLHARDVPGGHVVVKSAGRPVPERTLREAAGLAAHFSQARDDASVPVAVTDVRHVRRLPGGGPGMVTFGNAETLVVAPLSPQDLAAGGDPLP